jgi:hypothetical protein
MKLTATVVGIESSVKFTDEKQRIVLRIKGADPIYQDIRMPEPENVIVYLNQTVDLEIHFTERQPLQAQENLEASGVKLEDFK